MRWRKFWSERLNEDGTLGDPSAYWRRQQWEGTNRTPTNPYSNVEWTNISYENYIISQIGLGRTTSMAFHPSDAGTFYVGAAIGGIWKTMYSDFRTISTRMNHGANYPVSVRLNAVFAIDRVHVWIDYNRNGTFDASEAIPMGIPVNKISSGTVSVPLNAVKGATTMRVRVVYSETFDDPCGNAFGEVEDYTVFLDCVSGSTHGQCTLLPLTWLDFSAKPGGPGVAVLWWETGNETDLAQFFIERSYTGQDFAVIGEQEPLGYSQASTFYNFVDIEGRGPEAYYRIQAVDLDGTLNYSHIQRVTWEENGLGAKLYPNPAQDVLYLQLAIPNAGELNWEIQNLQGQTILQGANTMLISNENIAFPLGNLPAGVYLLRLRSPKGESNLTFVRE